MSHYTKDDIFDFARMIVQTTVAMMIVIGIVGSVVWGLMELVNIAKSAGVIR